ncbi:hypothetical protein [Pandoraea commovens]|uniref:Uncharacterized protein n=1 Tax=Pandoraea commovens TaxID=2508289 RepID=A0ABY5QGS6_9BURK|nr:hypothetical protein [Pandoraea commovens]UVA79992.1 hypothetical protein NTU39_02865 [Pandoraea commovens]
MNTGRKIEKALTAIQEALVEQSAEMAKQGDRLDRLETVVLAQARNIAELEADVKNLRDRAIQSAIDRGVPTKIVAQAHGLSPGRVSQIAPRKRPPLC